MDKTTKIVLDDYLEFNHTQYIIQRGGSCVLVPFALRVSSSEHFIEIFSVEKLVRAGKSWNDSYIYI